MDPAVLRGIRPKKKKLFLDKFFAETNPVAFLSCQIFFVFVFTFQVCFRVLVLQPSLLT